MFVDLSRGNLTGYLEPASAGVCVTARPRDAREGPSVRASLLSYVARACRVVRARVLAGWLRLVGFKLGLHRSPTSLPLV